MARPRTSAAPLSAPPPIDLDESALFLDLDGVLAPFEMEPRLVGPLPRRTGLLRKLSVVSSGRLAVISGRRIADIDRILEGRVFAVAGAHGLERRSRRGFIQTEGHPDLAEATSTFRALGRRHPDLLVEDKTLSVAVHYRKAPHLSPGVLELAAALCARTGLAIQRGDQVVELRTPGPDKGDAVRAFMAESPFAGRRPIFVGDDLTDEAGFRAATALGGFGVVVGPRRPTDARYALASVEHALAWLERLADARALESA